MSMKLFDEVIEEKIKEHCKCVRECREYYDKVSNLKTDKKRYIYLFILGNTFTDFEIISGETNYRDAVYELAKKKELNGKVFEKCLKGFDTGDRKEITELYNHFSHRPITYSCIIDEEIYKEV